MLRCASLCNKLILRFATGGTPHEYIFFLFPVVVPQPLQRETPVVLSASQLEPCCSPCSAWHRQEASDTDINKHRVGPLCTCNKVHVANCVVVRVVLRAVQSKPDRSWFLRSRLCSATFILPCSCSVGGGSVHRELRLWWSFLLSISPSQLGYRCSSGYSV